MGEKIEIARLNMTAGMKAKSSAAFGPALVYLQAASNLVGKDFWDTDYTFTFSIFFIFYFSYHEFILTD